MTTKAELRKLLEETRANAADAYRHQDTRYAAGVLWVAERLESLLAREDEPERVARERIAAIQGELRGIEQMTPFAYFDKKEHGRNHRRYVEKLRAELAALDAAERSRT